MPTFTPPTEAQSSDDPFWGRYSIQVGISIVKDSGGTYRRSPYPWLGELTGTEGTDWFLGGRTYAVSDDVAVALMDDGYTVDGTTYGLGPYGSGTYGG